MASGALYQVRSISHSGRAKDHRSDSRRRGHGLQRGAITAVSLRRHQLTAVGGYEKPRIDWLGSCSIAVGL